jgi:L-malate glycosyltransferase
MKVNFLLPCYAWGPSGGFKVVYEYANRLVARGHQVTVIHPRRLKFPPPEELTIRKRIRIARLWLKEICSEPLIDWHRVDPRVRLLYVPSSDQRYVPDSDILFATAWHTVRSVEECSVKKGEKCYLIQGYETWQGPQNLVNDTWLAPLRKVVVSRWLQQIGAELGCSDISYVPNAVDVEQYRVITPIGQRTRQVAMAFSPVAVKALRDGIKALDIAKKHLPNLRAILFGKERRASFIPLWINYVQNPSQEQLVEQIFNNSAIVMSSSIAEGFGLPPAEGAACGCAMVTTDSGGVRDFITHGKTGLLSPPRDPEALARNLCLLLANDDLRIRLAQAGHALVVGFNWERSTDLLESFLNGVVQNPVPHRPSVAVTPPPQMQVSRLETN